ncbi:ATP-binding protein [Streptomyces sp. NPDC017246]
MVAFSHVSDGEGREAPAPISTASDALDPRTDFRAFASLVSPSNGARGTAGAHPFAGEESVLAASGLRSAPAYSYPTGHPAYSQTLPREPQSAAVARRLVSTALTLWSLEALISDARLVITELVSNAVGHSRLPLIRVIVARPSTDGVRLGVVDRSKAIPILRSDVADDQTRGRGLLLVDALTDRWGTELYRWGKQVWAELRKGSGQ